MMANTDATADKIGFIGNHETIVDMNARPVCSPRVIALNRYGWYGWNGRFAVFRIGVSNAVL